MDKDCDNCKYKLEYEKKCKCDKCSNFKNKEEPRPKYYMAYYPDDIRFMKTGD